MSDQALSKRETQLKSLREAISALHNEITSLRKYHKRGISDGLLAGDTDRAVGDFIKETGGVFQL